MQLAKKSDFRRLSATSGGKQRLQARKSEKRQKMARNGKKDRESAKKGKKQQKLENGRYEHAPMRSNTSIRVYATADADTNMSTPYIAVSQQLISLEQAGCLENAAYTQWVTHSIQG